MPSALSDSLDLDQSWLQDQTHRQYLVTDAERQLNFFQASLRADQGFHTLRTDGTPFAANLQELHTTTRLVHSYALAKRAGFKNCDAIVDQGLRYLINHHRDTKHGGYIWALDENTPQDIRKLAYGHVFVLLAASTAYAAGHPEALALLDDVTEVIEGRFWSENYGVLYDEWNQDWTPFSTYRGFNANMHAVEALLSAFEATGQTSYIEKAGKILAFFVDTMAPNNDWRIPEHYTENWHPDWSYSGDPMFRPAGTTPGHSFEIARLSLQHWDLLGRPEGATLEHARKLIYRALEDAWDVQNGGLIYSLTSNGKPDVTSRYWWPITEAIGALATLIKIGGTCEDERWYRKLWRFADQNFIDHEYGGWHPEIDPNGQPTGAQFAGKPDIYHALQATLFPLTSGISRYMDRLPELSKAHLEIHEV